MNRNHYIHFFKYLYKHLTHTTFLNEHLLPTTGPLIIVLNHMSRLDFPMITAWDYRQDWTALVADSYKNWALFKKMADDAGLIWIDRSKADFTAMKLAFQWLKNGGVLVLSPEGTRSKTGRLIEAKSGAVMLAAKSGVPVCTGSITGTETSVNDLLHFRKPKLSVRFSPPYMMAPIDPDHREASLQQSTDELMCRIAAMLPEKYHGFYRGNQRIQSLREEWSQDPSILLPTD